MKILKRLIRYFIFSSGFLLLVMIALAFTDLPYLAYHQLGTHCKRLKTDPEVIVVFGGSGMPSPDGLMRAYYAAEAANTFPQSSIIIAHPFDNDSMNTYQLDLMKNELMIRGIDGLRISYEPNGFDTHSQAKNISVLLKEQMHLPTLVITSPEHMYRSIRSLQKAGLQLVGGLPSFEKPISEQKLRSKKHPERTADLPWRYNVWSYLKYELLVLREYCAITYYKLRGWI